MKHVVILFLLALAFPRLSANFLTLVDKDGRELKAKVVDTDALALHVIREDGRSFKIPYDNLSEGSLKKINEWIRESKSTFFSPQDYESYPFEIDARTSVESLTHSGSRISVIKVRGSEPKFIEGAEYVVIGSLVSDNYDEESIFIGRGNGFDATTGWYPRIFEPKERWSKFKLGVRLKNKDMLELALVGRNSSRRLQVLILE